MLANVVLEHGEVEEVLCQWPQELGDVKEYEVHEERQVEPGKAFPHERIVVDFGRVCLLTLSEDRVGNQEPRQRKQHVDTQITVVQHLGEWVLRLLGAGSKELRV